MVVEPDRTDIPGEPHFMSHVLPRAEMSSLRARYWRDRARKAAENGRRPICHLRRDVVKLAKRYQEEVHNPNNRSELRRFRWTVIGEFLTRDTVRIRQNT